MEHEPKKDTEVLIQKNQPETIIKATEDNRSSQNKQEVSLEKKDL